MKSREKDTRLSDQVETQTARHLSNLFNSKSFSSFFTGKTKLEPLSIVILSVVMSLASVEMIKESIEKIVHYVHDPHGGPVVKLPTVLICVVTVGKFTACTKRIWSLRSDRTGSRATSNGKAELVCCAPCRVFTLNSKLAKMIPEETKKRPIGMLHQCNTYSISWFLAEFIFNWRLLGCSPPLWNQKESEHCALVTLACLW